MPYCLLPKQVLFVTEMKCEPSRLMPSVLLLHVLPVTVQLSQFSIEIPPPLSLSVFFTSSPYMTFSRKIPALLGHSHIAPVKLQLLIVKLARVLLMLMQ